MRSGNLTFHAWTKNSIINSVNRRPSQEIMESEEQFPCSQEPDTRPYLEPMNPVHILTYCLLDIHFNIIFPFSPTSLSHPLLLDLSTKIS
jgi:hypothetical protein